MMIFVSGLKDVLRRRTHGPNTVIQVIEMGQPIDAEAGLRITKCVFSSG